MKVISWNCGGAFRLKWKFIESENADIYIIQESEDPKKFTKEFNLAGTSYEYLAFSEDDKGILVYSRKYEIVKDKLEDLKMRYFLPFTCNNKKFVGIWTKDHHVVDIHSYCLVNSLINKAELKNRIFIGDFNSNVQHDGELLKRKYRGMKALNEWFIENGVISAYHNETREDFGNESQSTYWFPSKRRDRYYHIDYCYLPKDQNHKFKILTERLDAELKANKLSCDHYPLSVTLK